MSKGTVRASLVGLLILVGLFAGLDLAFPLHFDRLTPSTRVFAADGTLLHAFLTKPGGRSLRDPPAWRLATTVEDVDPLYLDMLLAFEDQRFYAHPGVDPIAGVRAVGQLVAKGRVVSGASTLSMQAARLLDPRRERSLKAKLIESFRALQLTVHQGKDETLSAYLTLAPFGGNLEGVRAGSLAWFGKEPTYLTPGEAALLVALPRAPERLRPDRFPEAARRERNAVLDRMIDRGVLTHSRGEDAKGEPIPSVRRPLPRLAPHLSRRLAAQMSEGADILTTLDADLQKNLETLALDTARTLGPEQSVALLAVESQTGHILASVGSPDESNAGRAGAIDMTVAVRSPGSALKPLIYAMGFEARILHPQTIMMDRPTRFGSYTPSNFDDAHWGEVTAEEALIHSLNVPAVMVLDRLGPMALSARLQAFGIPLRLPGGVQKPGLPLALGGLGVTLEDLVSIYGAIDAGGEAPAVSALPGQRDPRSLINPTSAWQVAAILFKTPPPQGYGSQEGGRSRSIAYKTGTSYGYRDAYAIGFDGTVTMGIWVGRPDGSPSPGDFGRRTAAPVLFQAFERLDRPKPRLRLVPDDGLALMDSPRGLPLSLQRFSPDPGGAKARALPLPDVASVIRSPNGPTVTFPPNGAIVEWTEDGPPLTLSAKGGQRPLVWLVEGRPLPTAPHTRQAQWTPGGAGDVKITVVDALGRSSSARIWLKTSP